MAKAIIYCEKCGKLVSPRDVEHGSALVFGEIGVCPQCVASLSPDDLRDMKRRGEPGSVPGGSPAAPAARRPQAPSRAESARALAGRRPRKGVVVPAIALGALVGTGAALVWFVRSRQGPARGPERPPDATAIAPAARAGPRDPPDPDDPGPVDAAQAAASQRLNEIRSWIDPSLGRYAEARAALLEFAAECDQPSVLAEANALLARIDADFAAKADEDLAKATESAEALASEGNVAGAKAALDQARERFGGSEWFRERGEKAIAEALGRIGAARAEAAKAVLARAREAFESGRFDEARAALEARADWPEQSRATADDLLKEMDERVAGLGADRKRREAWAAFLLGFVDAGSKGLGQAKAFLERERDAFAKLGPDEEIEGKLDRIERLFGDAGLVEELAGIGLQGARGTIYLVWKGERVGGKVQGVEDGVLRLKSTRGADLRIPVSEIAAADVVQHSGTAREGSRERFKAAVYLFLRGEPAAAGEASGGAAGDGAAALREQIDEFARAVEARRAREEADATQAAAAAEAKDTADSAARAGAAAAAEAKREAEAAAQDLVAHWKFDERSGQVAKDSSGRGNHAAVWGATWAPNGRLGGALYLDGRDDHVLVPRPIPLDFSGPFTVVMWVKLGSVSRFDPLIGVTQDAGNYAFCLCIEGGPRLYTKVNGQWSGTDACGASIRAGDWCHVAATVGANSYCALYLNGARVLAGGIGQRNNRGILHIGRMANSSAWTEAIEGLVDDVRVYGRALSAEEVRGLFDGSPPAATAAREAGPAAPDAGAGAAGPDVAEAPSESDAVEGRVPGEAPARPALPRQNLLENGGFEEKDSRGFAQGWTKEQWGARGAKSAVRLDMSNPHGGEAALSVRGLTEDARPGASANLRLEPGTYGIRYWACADVGASATVGVRFAGMDLPGHAVGDRWMQITENVTVEKRGTNTGLGLWVSTPGVQVWFDDVEFVRE